MPKRSFEEDFQRALAASKQLEGQVKRHPGKRTPVAPGGRFSGTCQACFNRQIIKGDPSTVVLHGYQRPGIGFITGKCPGTGELPYEVSSEFTASFAAELVKQYEDDLEDLKKFEKEDRTITVALPTIKSWVKPQEFKIKPGWTHPDAEKSPNRYGPQRYSYEILKEKEIRSRLANLQQMEGYIKFLHGMVAKWEPKELKPADEREFNPEAEELEKWYSSDETVKLMEATSHPDKPEDTDRNFRQYATKELDYKRRASRRMWDKRMVWQNRNQNTGKPTLRFLKNIKKKLETTIEKDKKRKAREEKRKISVAKRKPIPESEVPSPVPSASADRYIVQSGREYPGQKTVWTTQEEMTVSDPAPDTDAGYGELETTKVMYPLMRELLGKRGIHMVRAIRKKTGAQVYYFDKWGHSFPTWTSDRPVKE